jgi:hypothetical protein
VRPLRIGIVVGVATTALALVASTASGTTSKLVPSKLKATGLTPTKVYQGVKSNNAPIAQTDPSLLGRGESTPINVLIKYDFASTASYKGGVDGLAATSPRKTGKSLRENRGAVQAYESYTHQRASKITSALTSSVAGANVRSTFQTVYGGVEARVPANAVASVLKVPGVVAV